MTPVLAFFVVLGTGTAIYLLNQDDPEPRGEELQVEEIVEIAPALPRVSLVPDSVPAEPGEPEDAGGNSSLLEGFEWQDDRDRRRRFEKSLEKTISEVEGLGVYVEPPPKKKEKR